MPKIKLAPQISWMGIVNAENKTINGPGHSPPIPHPNPKQKAPPISCRSILLFCGLKTLQPVTKLVPFLLMIVNVTILTAKPQPSTKRRAGFQNSLIWRNCRILSLRDIPESISPQAKTMPTKKTISWSIICFLESNSIFCLFEFLASTKPTIGRTAPTAKNTPAEMVLS